MNSEAFVRFSSEAIRLIAEPALRAIVMAGVAGFALWVSRVRSVPAKLAVWTAVLCGAVVLPLLGWLLPPIFVRLPIMPARPPTQTAVLQTGELVGRRSELIRPTRIARTGEFVAVAGGPQLDTARETEHSVHAVKHTFVAWPTLMFSTYLLVLAVLVGRLCVGFILTRQMRRSAISVKDPGAWQLIERCAREMEVRSVPQLLESPAVNVPLTLGVLRPAIVIPQSWRKWEEAKLAAVIAHELSHVRRRDPLTRMLAAVYRSIFWFSPLGWWLECQLANLGEQASDEAAIGAGTEPTYYAEVLMSFFRTIQSGQGRMNWQGARMAGGARAANRIDRVLSLKMLKPSGLKKSLLIGLMAGGLPVLCLTATARPKFTLASAAAPQSAAVAQASPAPLPAPAVPAVPPPASANGGPATVPSVSPSAPVPPRIKLQLPRFPNLQPEAQPVLPVLAANSDQERTPISTHNGMDFAIVSGQSVMMSGSEDDRSEVESLRKKIPGDFIWFIHNGNAYVIRDAATVQAAKQLYAPMEDLGRQQEALGKQQEELGRHQEELGKQMEAVRVDVPADLAQRLQAVEAKIKALGGSANMDQLGHLQGELGDLQGQLGSLQGKAGEAQGRLGQQQGALGEKQGELGHRQGELGREQGRIAHEAARQMQDIIGKALSNGTAKRVD